MKKLLLLLIVLGGSYKLFPEFFQSLWVKGAFDEQGNPIVQVFVSDGCKDPCDKAIRFLEKRKLNPEIFNLDDGGESLVLWEGYGSLRTLPVVAMGKEVISGYDKPQYIARVATVYGDEGLTKTEQSILYNHFYDDGSPRVIVYGASWCPHCKRLKGMLDAENIPFEDIDVEATADGPLVIRTLQIGGYPVTYVGYERVDGVNLEKIKNHLP
jgi:glutaredoxin